MTPPPLKRPPCPTSTARAISASLWTTQAFLVAFLRHLSIFHDTHPNAPERTRTHPNVPERDHSSPISSMSLNSLLSFTGSSLSFSMIRTSVSTVLLAAVLVLLYSAIAGFVQMFSRPFT